MVSRKENRVRFFSKEDMSAGMNLSTAEPILRNYDSSNVIELNDIIELYQIKKYIDNDLFLLSWTDEDKLLFKEKVKSIWNSITLFWLNINTDNFITFFDSVEVGYQPAFWELTEKLKVFKNLSKEKFIELLNNDHLWIREVLHQKDLVKYFGEEIRTYILKKENAAELLLSQYEEHHDKDYPELHFPNCLNQIDKEQIILNYLNSKDVNINYVRLIIKSRDNNLKLSPHTRLKAKRLAEELNNKILEEGHSWNVGTEVSLSIDQEEPYKETWENNIQRISYSVKWLDKQKDNLSLFHNFSLLFDYTDIFGSITLVSKESELDVMEKIFMRSKNEYLKGMTFTRKSNLSHLQLFLYSQYLNKIENSVESILYSFVNSYLIDVYNLKNLRINFPSKNTSYLEKIRLIVPEIESILKQYKIFVDDGIIDHELLQISSQSIVYGEVSSLSAKKYVYGIGNEFLKLKYYFFSDQSMLSYVEPFKDKYRHLYGLLIKENVKLSDFQSYQKSTIDNLIQDGYLIIDSNDYVRIKEQIQLFIIGKLYFDEVVSYWYFPEGVRSVIDIMNEKGLLYFGNTLFSEPEKKYFNYYLNKAEYTNGLDLRNKYAHGTNSTKEEEHKNDYLILLKVLILVLLKIENDLLIFENYK